MTETTAKPVARMRTIGNIVAEIKELDPETDITTYYIRQLVKKGMIPVAFAGRKALINLDSVLDLLYSGTKPSQSETPDMIGGIRRIDV